MYETMAPSCGHKKKFHNLLRRNFTSLNNSVEVDVLIVYNNIIIGLIITIIIIIFRNKHIACTGSCEWETKHRERQIMAPASIELSRKRIKQPPCAGEFLLGERWRAYTLSQVNCDLELSSAQQAMQINLTFDNLRLETKGGTGPLMVGHFQRDHTHVHLLVPWLTANIIGSLESVFCLFCFINFINKTVMLQYK